MTLSIWTLLALIVGHFVGDFLLQSDWMALNKSKWPESQEGRDALTVHAAVYAASIGLFTLNPFVALITFVAHAVTDAITSRWTTKLWFLPMEQVSKSDNLWYAYPDWKKRHWFFVVIGFDQMLHGIQLVLTAWGLGL